MTLLVALCAAYDASAQAPPPPPPPPPLTPLPAPLAPAGNAVTLAKSRLGKALFWDEQLSSTRTVACGSCHQAGSGGSDARSAPGSVRATNPGSDGAFGTTDDVTGSPGVELNAANGSLLWSAHYGLGEQVTGRLAPSHINAAYAPSLFWDGRASGTFTDPTTGTTALANGAALESQASGPPVADAEMAHVGRSWFDVVDRVLAVRPLALASDVASDLAEWMAERPYAALFEEAFGSPGVTAARVAMAIGSYERTLFSTRAPIDSLIAGTATLTPQETQGMQLFGQLGCAGCHAGSLFSDEQFHFIGESPAAEDSGRMIVTHNPGDLGAFRTPSLRNVSLRPAYMHDGRFRTLTEVVDFYNRGGDFTAPNLAPGIRPLGLTAQQRAAVVAFLGRPLTDPRVASASAPFDQPTLYTASGLVPALLAGGTPGASGLPPQPVALEPPLAGNPSFTVGVFGALAGASAVLVIDDAEPPVGSIPASGSLAREQVTLSGSGTSGGFGSVSIAIPESNSMVGRVFYGRWYVNDPSAVSGVAASPAFRFRVFDVHQDVGAGTVAVGAMTGASIARLYTGYPNPFVNGTTVRFDLLRPSAVRLLVYDASGRLVRHLDRRDEAAPGAYLVPWDGRDDGGRRVPAGIYLYRLETRDEAVTARVVRIP
jgi:cytochrome c peroxidase